MPRWLRQPVDNSPLVFFRIAFGFLIFLQAAGSIVLGHVHDTYVEPRYDFPIIGFEPLTVLAGPAMYAVFAVLAVAALGVMLGAWYRAALGLFTALWTTTYVMQTQSYNNHYYLMVLLCVLMLPTPAHAWASVDARRRPELRSLSCPRWCILVFVLQAAIVYEFAALAKLYPDWLDGSAIHALLEHRLRPPLVGWVYDEPWFRPFLVWGGILFDGLVVPLLLWRRTRLFALALGVFFHLFNSITFRIGVFPYTALALCAVFFPGEQVRRVFFRRKPPFTAADGGVAEPSRRSRLLMAALAVYFAVQLWLPLRYLLFPGNVHWTEEGHRMAWRMMLKAKSGTIEFTVRDPRSGQTWRVDPGTRLTPKQSVRLPTRPDMIWQFVQHLERDFAADGHPEVEIYARSSVSLNGRPPQPLVRPDVDLAKAEWHWFAHDDWITLGPTRAAPPASRRGRPTTR